MLDYTGVKCPVCGVPFGQDDDIVVCPECGAPYHRECYQKEGKCVFGELHEQGKEWEPPAPPKAPDPSAEIKDRECPVCGTLNGHSALFCSRCGASLLGEPQRYNNTYPGQSASGTGTGPVPPYGGRPGGVYGGPMPPFAFDPMGGVSPAETLDKDVTFGDASKLVKQNTNYYMPVFRYIKQTGRNKFNFCAFLFSGAWMLYRKQYKYGIVVTSLMFLLYASYQCAMYLLAMPFVASLAEQAGVDLTGMALTGEQQAALYNLLIQEPSGMWKLFLPYLCLGAMLVVMIVVGVRGNKMYLRHCVRTVRETKAADCEGGLSVGLDAKGGVNTLVIVCVAACYFAIQCAALLLLI